MNIRARIALWKPAGAYLVGLALFFFASYGVANRYAASLDFVPTLSYPWEKHIPFLPWTVIPYWSMDLLYGVSLFLCTSKKELNIHALRLLTASLFCCACFMLFPLSCGAQIPALSAPWLHWIFSVTARVSTSFNQAPSLHIALAWLVWLRFLAHTHGFIRIFWNAWFILIGISVLTCYQHHFIDVPLGFFTGVFISYCLPVRAYPRAFLPGDWRRVKLAVCYIAGSCLFAAAAWHVKGLFLCFLWPALSLLLVGLGYAAWGTSVFQKDERGALSLSARILLAPYRLGAWLSKCYFSRKLPENVQIADGIFLGGLPKGGRICQDGLLDLTAEFDSSSVRCRWKSCCPRMDLIAQTPEQLQQAVEKLEHLSRKGTVLICCALGLSRSAAVAAAFLTRREKTSVRESIAEIFRRRPQAVLTKRQQCFLLKWEQNYIMYGKFPARRQYDGKNVR